MSNPFVWFDLRTPEKDAAERFYGSLLGWKIDDNGAVAGEGQPWGAVAGDPELSSGHWLPYIQVEDVDAATAQAVELGAAVVQPKTAGPAGHYVTIKDPGGAQVALWQGPDSAEAAEAN